MGASTGRKIARFFLGAEGYNFIFTPTKVSYGFHYWCVEKYGRDSLSQEDRKAVSEVAINKNDKKLSSEKIAESWDEKITICTKKLQEMEKKIQELTTTVRLYPVDATLTTALETMSNYAKEYESSLNSLLKGQKDQESESGNIPGRPPYQELRESYKKEADFSMSMLDPLKIANPLQGALVLLETAKYKLAFKPGLTQGWQRGLLQGVVFTFPEAILRTASFAYKWVTLVGFAGQLVENLREDYDKDRLKVAANIKERVETQFSGLTGTESSFQTAEKQAIKRLEEMQSQPTEIATKNPKPEPAKFSQKIEEEKGKPGEKGKGLEKFSSLSQIETKAPAVTIRLQKHFSTLGRGGYERI